MVFALDSSLIKPAIIHCTAFEFWISVISLHVIISLRVISYILNILRDMGFLLSLRLIAGPTGPEPCLTLPALLLLPKRRSLQHHPNIAQLAFCLVGEQRTSKP